MLAEEDGNKINCQKMNGDKQRYDEQKHKTDRIKRIELIKCFN